MPIIRSLRLYRWPQLVAPHLGYGRLLVWCMAVGLSLRVGGCCKTSVVQHPDDGHNNARNMLSESLGSINHRVASSWFYSLNIIDDARTNTHQRNE
jgi:hypothetical protein